MCEDGDQAVGGRKLNRIRATEATKSSGLAMVRNTTAEIFTGPTILGSVSQRAARVDFQIL
jgi:hypothetical protein